MKKSTRIPHPFGRVPAFFGDRFAENNGGICTHSTRLFVCRRSQKIGGNLYSADQNFEHRLKKQASYFFEEKKAVTEKASSKVNVKH